MRKLLFVSLLIFGLPLTSAGQLIPQAAIFGGYTFVHDTYEGGGSGFSLNGWDGSVELKPVPWLGFVADVSQQYGLPFSFATTNPGSQTTVLFGPQFSLPGSRRVIPFAHALGGFVHSSDVQYNNIIPYIVRGSYLSVAVGGGLDFKLAGPVWVRAIQADWMYGDVNSDYHPQVRLAAGIVFRFGR